MASTPANPPRPPSTVQLFGVGRVASAADSPSSATGSRAIRSHQRGSACSSTSRRDQPASTSTSPKPASPRVRSTTSDTAAPGQPSRLEIGPSAATFGLGSFGL